MQEKGVTGAARLPEFAYVVLGYIGEYPEGVHGYKLGGVLAGLRPGLPSVRLGQLYRVLHHLQRMGFVKSRVDGEGPRPPRHRFRTTAEGRVAFRRWLLAPPDGGRPLTEHVLNRLQFSDRMPTSSLCGLLDRAIWRCEVAANELRPDTAGRGSQPRPASLHGLATEARMKAERSWLNEVRELIRELPAPAPAACGASEAWS